MKAWPRSLFGRHLMLIVVLVALGQLVGALLVSELLLRPRMARTAELAAGQIGALRQGLEAVPPVERAAFVTAFNARITGDRAHDGDAPARLLAPLQRNFIREVSRQLGREGADLLWRREQGSPLAVRLLVEGQEFWIAVPNLFTAREFSGAWLAASLAGAALAALGAWLIQRHLNRPLSRLVSAARSLETGVPPPTLPEDGPTEIATLSRSFNQMVEGLARQEQERAVMLAGISHDLRTPLTKLHLGLEILRPAAEPEVLDSLARSLDDMDRMLGQFLDFARVGDARACEPAVLLDPADLATEAARAAERPGERVECQLPYIGLLQAQPLAVRRALDNLLANARRHGRPPIELSIARRQEGGGAWVVISVADHGPGIAMDQQQRVRQPFQRAQEARSGAPGSGLGLAIVERVAHMHGGRLALRARDGGGLVAELWLPVAGAIQRTQASNA